MCQFLHQPCQSDNLAVSTMKKFGAVPFCLTNVPQSMYSLQCSNPPYGTTVNAFNPAKETGGSSGGEGSLIGSGGSILGLGSDVGGSLRNPAAFNGIYSLKPTFGRHLSQLGNRGPTTYEQPGFRTVSGFMSSSAKALVFAWKTLLNEGDQHLQDPSISPLKWQDDLYNPGQKKLTIGYYDTDGFFDPHPGCKRAVQEAVEKLKAKGHELVEFHAPPPETQEIYMGLMFADGFKNIKESMDKDVLVDNAMLALGVTHFILKCPDLVRRVVNCLGSLITKEYFPKPCLNGDQVMSAIHRRDQVSLEYLQEMSQLGLDLILTPASLFPAPDKECIGEMPSAVRIYTPWNVLNMPAGIAPITKVTENDEKNMKSMPANDMFYKFMRKKCQDSVGLPLAVQIVGRRFHEELILSLMSEIDDDL